MCLLAFALGSASSRADADVSDSPNRNLTGFEGLNEQQPLWEVGVGGGMVEVPNYPASGETNSVALALPYVIYRGDIFRLGGQGGARAVFFEKSDFEVDLMAPTDDEEGGDEDEDEGHGHGQGGGWGKGGDRLPLPPPPPLISNASL